MTDFLSFFFPKAKVIEEAIDPREKEIIKKPTKFDPLTIKNEEE